MQGKLGGGQSHTGWWCSAESFVPSSELQQASALASSSVRGAHSCAGPSSAPFQITLFSLSLSSSLIKISRCCGFVCFGYLKSIDFHQIMFWFCRSMHMVVMELSCLRIGREAILLFLFSLPPDEPKHLCVRPLSCIFQDCMTVNIGLYDC